MLYNPPTGSTDPNAPYLGKNVAAGQMGSKIPPAAVELPQREIVAVVADSRQAPTNADPKQLLRAIRSGQLEYFSDQGAPNAIVIVPATSHASYVPGCPFLIKLANNVTGATTVAVGDLTALPVRYPGGGDLKRGDFLAGDVLPVVVNGTGTGFTTSAQVNQATIDTAVVKTVHGAGADFPDLNAAIAWINRRRVAATGSVVLLCAAGVGALKTTYNQSIIFAHPDGLRISILGQGLSAAQPAPSTLTVSGNTASARLSDTATNLNTLRNVYASEIAFTGGARLFINSNLGNLQDILFTSDGAGSADNVVLQGGVATFTRIASFGAANRGILVTQGFVNILGTCYAIGNGGNGASAETGGNIGVTGTLAGLGNVGAGLAALASSTIGTALTGTPGVMVGRGNANEGLLASGGSTIQAGPTSYANTNGTNGFSSTNNSTVIADGTVSSGNSTGYNCTGAGVLTASNSSGSNTAYGFVAFNGGNIARSGSTATGTTAAASPAAGSVGNANSFIA